MLFQQSIGLEFKEQSLIIVLLKGGFKRVKPAAQAEFALEGDKPLKERLAVVRTLLGDFMRAHRLGNTEIFLGLPSDMAIVRPIEFPLAVKENLGATLRYEMEKYVPLPPDQVYFDYHILSEDKGKNRLEVLLFVVKKSALAPYLKFARGLNSGLSGIELQKTALANLCAYGRSRWGDAIAPDIPDLLKSPETPVLPGSLLSKSGLSAPEFAPAFGLALKPLTEPAVHINLLPREMRKKPSKLGYYTLLVLAGLALLSVLAWGGSHILQQRLMVRELNAEMARLVSEVKNIDRIQAEFESLETRIERINALQVSGVSPLDLLNELSQIIPETAWVRDFSLSENEVQLDGYAESASELLPILEGSPLFENAVFLSTITKNREGLERFRIGVEVHE